MHIPDLDRNLIYISKMNKVGAHTAFEKGICKMVRGAMVLMRGVRYRTLYKLLGIIVIDGCNNSVVSEIKMKKENS